MKHTVILALAAAAALTFPLSAFAGEGYASGGVVSHDVGQSPQEIEDYWTVERMKNAQPMPMPSAPAAPPPGLFVPPAGPDYPPGAAPGASPVACTADAKICPDGTAVSRTGPDCQFAPCPAGRKSR